MAWTTGCGVETEVQGVIADADLNTPELMVVLARGTNSELGDVFAACDYAYRSYSPTDEAYNSGLASSEWRYTTMQYQFRPAGSCFEQATEASWAALYSVNRMTEVDQANGVDPDSDPLIARMWLNGGLGERQLGEMFCNAVYNYGPDGGILLGGGASYDPGVVVGQDSIFNRVLTYADNAIAVAQAGIAANVETPDDWYLFDPQVTLTSAYGLKAQVNLLLGNLTEADEYARLALSQPAGMLPPSEHNLMPGGAGVDFIEYTHMNTDTEANDVHYWFHRSDDVGLWNTPAAIQWPEDPRVPQIRCGEFKEGVTPGGNKSSSDFINLSSLPECSLELNNEYRHEMNDYPRWVQLKYFDRGSDMEMVTGTEMLLIRAEVAMEEGRSADFINYIDQLRAHYGLDPLAVNDPDANLTIKGDLEYPNAEDDMWSILDRERYLELWLEGRRYADFRRWNHPYWTQGFYQVIEHEARNGPGPRPAMCFDGSYGMPLPESECGTNPLIRTGPECATINFTPPGG
jgi:hypothetical protein